MSDLSVSTVLKKATIQIGVNMCRGFLIVDKVSDHVSVERPDTAVCA